MSIIKKYYKLALGYLLIILGFIGLFVPILQGILFLTMGTVLLSTHSKAFYKLKERIKAKYPQTYAYVKARIPKDRGR
jgi:uncharacterized membrane protein YbaN (DUF454 family)